MGLLLVRPDQPHAPAALVLHDDGSTVAIGRKHVIDDGQGATRWVPCCVYVAYMLHVCCMLYAWCMYAVYVVHTVHVWYIRGACIVRACAAWQARRDLSRASRRGVASKAVELG